MRTSRLRESLECREVKSYVPLLADSMNINDATVEVNMFLVLRLVKLYVLQSSRHQASTPYKSKPSFTIAQEDEGHIRVSLRSILTTSTA